MQLLPLHTKEAKLLLARSRLVLGVFQVDSVVALDVDKEVFVLVVALAAPFDHVHLRDAILQWTVNLCGY